MLLTASGRGCAAAGSAGHRIDTLQRAAGLLAGADQRADAETQLVAALALAGRVDEALAVGTGLLQRLAGDP